MAKTILGLSVNFTDRLHAHRQNARKSTRPVSESTIPKELGWHRNGIGIRPTCELWNISLEILERLMLWDGDVAEIHTLFDGSPHA